MTGPIRLVDDVGRVLGEQPEVLRVADQRLAVRHLRRHVDDLGHEAVDDARLVAQRAQERIRPDHRPVGMAEPTTLVRVLRLPGRDLAQDLAHAGLLVLRRGGHHAQANECAIGQSDELMQGGVGIRHDAVDVREQDADGGLIHGQLVAGLPRTCRGRHFVGLDHRRDVRHPDDRAGRLTVGACGQRDTEGAPQRGSVRLQHRRQALPRALPQFTHLRLCTRRDERPDGHAHEVLRGSAQDGPRARRGPGDRPVSAHLEHDIRGVLGEQPVARLALHQRLLRAVPVRDVAPRLAHPVAKPHRPDVVPPDLAPQQILRVRPAIADDRLPRLDHADVVVEEARASRGGMLAEEPHADEIAMLDAVEGGRGLVGVAELEVDDLTLLVPDGGEHHPRGRAPSR